MELLTEKYADLLESKKMPQIAEGEQSTMAVLLENQAQEETKMLGEGTTASDVAAFTPIFMPLARRIQPTLIANEIIGVQPLTSPTGFIYTLAFRYTGMGANATDRTGGRISPVAGGQILEVEDASAITKGQTVKVGADSATVIFVEGKLVLIDAQIGSAGATLNDDADNAITTIDATFSNELTFRKILKGYTGSLPTSEAEILGYDMAEVGFEIKQTQIAVKSRKLKAEYSVEMYEDLKAMHGINADEELMNMMAIEVQNELDREIVDLVNGWAAPAADFNIGGANASGSTRFEIEGMAHLGLKISNEAREIARLTRRGAGNIVIASPKVVTVLEQLNGFKAIANASKIGSGVGASVVGTFNGMKVVMDAFATRDYVTVLYKGADRRDAIGYYAPYVPVSFTRVVHPESGQPGIILNSRYGVKENPLNENEGIYGRTFSVNFDASSVLA